MSLKEEIENDYFDWLYETVAGRRDGNSKKISYKKLLSALHIREFYFILPMDENRAMDGIDLRSRFAYECKKYSEKEVIEYLDGPCSVLEMMIALTLRIEDEIIGDSTQWFWLMIFNLGLNDMMDTTFDREKVGKIIDIFLERKYEKDGKGGLFIIKNRVEDLRNVEIWYQMQWYIGEINIEMR